MSKYPFDISEIKKLDCKNAQIGVHSEHSVRWWMERLPKKMDILSLSTISMEGPRFWITSEVLEIPQIAQAQNVEFKNCINFSTTNFVDVKNENFGLECDTVSEKEVNQFLKKMIEKDGVNGFTMLACYGNSHKMLEGLWERGQELRDFQTLDSGLRDYLDSVYHCPKEFFFFHIPCVVNPSESITLVDSDGGRVEIYGNWEKSVASSQWMIRIISPKNTWKDKQKQEVTKYLDYPSRCQLERCSKQDYQTVKDTPVAIKRMEIVEDRWKGEHETVTVHIEFSTGGDAPRLKFSQCGDDTLIKWNRPSYSETLYNDENRYSNSKEFCNRCKCCDFWQKDNRKLVLPSSNYYEEAVKFAEKWMKKCNYEMKSIYVSMTKNPFENSGIRMLSKCKSAQIAVKNVESARWWLDRLPEKMENILLRNLGGSEVVFPAEIMKLPQIAQATRIAVYGRTTFTDQDLINCKFEEFSFDNINLTQEGINQFLKNRLNGTARNVFKEASLPGVMRRIDDPFDMLEGFIVQPYEELKVLYPEYCDLMDTCCDDVSWTYLKSPVDPCRDITLVFDSELKITENDIKQYYELCSH